MNTERAKEILRAMHACETAVSAEEAESACEMLERNSALQQWFGEDCSGHSAFDLSISEKLEQLPPPDGLCDRVTAASAPPASPAAPLVRLLVPAMAAAALFVAALFVFRPDSNKDGKSPPIAVVPSAPSVEGFRSDMALFASEGFDLQHRQKDLPGLTRWLADNTSPVGDLNPAIHEREAFGCSVVKWGEAQVSLICFHTPDGEVVHLFAANLHDIAPGAGVLPVEKETAGSGLETASWSDGTNLYVLVGSKPGVEIDTLL